MEKAKARPFACKQCNKTYRKKDWLVLHVQEQHGTELRECKECGSGGRQYGSRGLKSHVQRIHGAREPSVCPFCGLNLADSKQLDSHLRSRHTGERPFACTHPECRRRFASDSQLHNHRKIHSGVKPFPCTSCEKTFRSAENLKNHVRVHTGEKPFPCPECGQHFRHQLTLKQHTMRHRGEKPFSCTYCSYKCVTSGLLQHHLRTHTGEKPFRCNLCPASYPGKGSLDAHIERDHTQVGNRRKYPCRSCDKVYLLASSLKRHVINQHSDKNQDRLITCEICRKPFPHEESLHAHMKNTHQSSTRFTCNFCDKSLKNKTNLVTHLRTHTGEKPYTCSVCGKGWKTKTELKQHIKTHEIERVKPYTCEYCPVRFYTRFNLQLHLARCKGRPVTHTCQICNNGFPSQDSLAVHSRIHDAGRKREFACRRCGKQFFTSTAANKHWRNVPCLRNGARAEPSAVVPGPKRTEPTLYELRVVLPPLDLEGISLLSKRT